MKRLVGISTGVLQLSYGDKKSLEIAAKIGADSVDFDLSGSPECYSGKEGSLYSKGEDAVIEYYTDLKNYADKLGIIIGQTHSKTPGFKNIKEQDDRLVKDIGLDCLATSVLGAPVMVLHNATSIYMGADPDPELMHSLSYGLFSRTIPFAKKYGIKIATETFGDAVQYNACDFFGKIDEFEKAYKAIKSVDEFKDNFTVCVDTGHSNKAMRFGNPKPGDVIRRIGSDISVLHLNDNDTLTDQHKIPMTGTIDWNDVFNALDEVGYSGIYNMELELRHFGNGFMVETAEFAVMLMRYILKERYGEQ